MAAITLRPSTVFIAAAALAGSLAGAPAMAGPAADALGTCLADNTTGKERKALAKWVFVAISAHPDIKDVSAATAADKEETSRTMATLFTRLVTESCAGPARKAIEQEGTAGFQSAFSSLGALAMQELTTHPEVAAGVRHFERYVDRTKLEAAFKAK